MLRGCRCAAKTWGRRQLRLLDVLYRRLLLLLHVPLHVAHLHRVQAVVELHHVDVGLLVALLKMSA